MIDERWYARPLNAEPKRCAGGVVVRLERGRILIAFVRESKYSDFFLPKGHVEPGESLEQAARREIEEEAGLVELVYLDDLGVQERFNFPRTKWKRIHYFLYATDHETGTPTDSEHDYRLQWFALDDLPSIFWPEQRRLLEENRERIEAVIRQAI